VGFKGISTHSFRRTSITNLYRAGVDLKTIQQRSGHASIANVGLYIERLNGEAQKAGELL
jgi:integrase/recombinase XerD